MTRAERRKKAAEEREFLEQKLEENRFDNLMLDEISKKLSLQNELLVSIKNNVQFFLLYNKSYSDALLLQENVIRDRL